MNTKKIKEKLGFILLRLSVLFVVLFLAVILTYLVVNGARVLSWQFLTQNPENAMTQGGIFPALVGTFFVALITAIFSVPLGIFAAIYLIEYAPKGKFTRLIRLSIRNLSGVPSIIYGLFGVALFVQMLRFGASLLSSGLTLGLLTLPWIITASEEALKSVPASYREGAFALGASKWQVIRTNVLPYAFPGILTGIILGLSRAAGETAPILFTGVAFFIPSLPKSLLDQFMALPYHLYIMSTQHHDIEGVRGIAYGTALVLLIFILLLNLGAIIARYRMRKIRRA